MRRRPRLLGRLLALTVGGLLWVAPAALAGSATSANWSGYAVHRAGVRFGSVGGEWRVPTASCTAGSVGYSSIWVGLGGYSLSSSALEQTGSEADCTRSGRARYFAWYELVPAPPHSLSLAVRPGDLMRASVGAAGTRVTIAVSDLTAGRTFRRSFDPSQLDLTSAEWIVEAPSECTGAGQCFALPLANFGQASLFAAHATTTAGRHGTVTSHWWSSTEITLVPHGSRLFADMADPPGEAIPSSLTAGGSAFTVSYQPISGPGSGPPGRFFTTRASRTATGRLIHPIR
jgi:Peptidase A4 family